LTIDICGVHRGFLPKVPPQVPLRRLFPTGERDLARHRLSRGRRHAVPPQFTWEGVAFLPAATFALRPFPHEQRDVIRFFVQLKKGMWEARSAAPMALKGF